MKKKVLAFILLFFSFLSPVVHASSFFGSNDVAQVLSKPFVSILLLTCASVFLVVEVFVPAFGIFGFLGVFSYVLYFWANIAVGNAEWYTLLFFLAGVICGGVELLIPGFGLPGICGIALISTGLILGMGNIQLAVMSFAIAIIVAAVVFVVFVRKGFKSRFFRRLILDQSASTEKGYVSATDHSQLIGKRGMTLTDLRPTGFILVEDAKYDALSEGKIIKKDSEIEIIRMDGSNIIVRRIEG